MDFALTEDQEGYRACVVKFARKELNARAAENDAAGTFPFEEWKKAAAEGLTALPVPQEYGGLGYDLVTSAAIMDAFGYACTDGGLVHAVASHLICAIQISLFGNEGQKRKYLPAMSRGECIGATAATEPGAGSDSGAIRTRAEKQEGAYLLNGTKMFISNGPVADAALVLAVTDPARKSLGRISCLIVDKGTEGFEQGRPLEKMGLRSLPNGELIFTDCRVPFENLLGNEGQGSLVFAESMEWERVLLSACQTGVMQRVLETSTAYARAREQFGQAIGKFQSISNKIADMRMNLELARPMLYRTAWLKDKGKRAALESSVTKLFVSESLKTACLEAVQIHGAYGYMREYPVERELRDSVAATVYSGASEVQRNIIARLTGCG
jgi:alkylation response protein AidB-like acyl-CoA dehydrogenase